MPTTYAHYRFGQDVLEQLPADQRAVLLAHRPIFDFGVHGPDVLFYYRPMGKNPVNRKGYDCHSRTGRDFFTEACPGPGGRLGLPLRGPVPFRPGPGVSPLCGREGENRRQPQRH